MKRFLFGISIGVLGVLFLMGFVIYEKHVTEKNTSVIRAEDLAAQSYALRDTQFDLSSLLSVEAFYLTDTPRTRSSLLDSVQANPQLLRYLHQDASPVYSIAFSADEKIIATGHHQGAIILWDIETGKPLGSPLIKDADPVLGPVFSISFSPDGKILAAGIYTRFGDVRTLVLWDIESGQIISQPSLGDTSSVHDVAFSPDSQMLAIGDFKAITLWNVMTDQLVGKLSTEVSYPKIIFSADGKKLAAISDVNTISIWDTTTLNPIGKPLVVGNTNLDNIISNAAFGRDGETLITIGKDKSLIIWDLDIHMPIAQLPGLSTEDVRTDYSLRISRSTAFNPEKNLVAWNKGKKILLFDLITLRQTGQPLTGHTGNILCMQFSPHGSFFASGDTNGNLILWNLSRTSSISRRLEDTGHVSSLAFSLDGKTLATGGSPGPSITFWDVTTFRSIVQLDTEHLNSVESIAFDPKGRFLASGSRNSTAHLWDINTNELIGDLLVEIPSDGYSNHVEAVTFRPDGELLAIASGTKVYFWDTTTHTLVDHYLLRDKVVLCLDFSPDGKIIAVGDADGITLWDVDTYKRLDIELGINGTVYSLAFSPDGTLLASGGSSGVVQWNIGENTSVGQHLIGNGDFSSQSVVFSPDGKLLVSGNYDNTIMLWDTTTLQPIGRGLEGNTWPVGEVVFSPDGKILVSESNEVVFWDMEPQIWIEKICQRVGRNFTNTEWEYFFPEETYRATCSHWIDIDQ